MTADSAVPGAAQPSSVTFIGTATTLLRLGPFNVLTDPNFLHQGQWTHVGQGLITRRRTEPAMQPDELPPLTAVVLSHLHGDHFDRTASRSLSADLPIITTAHAARRLERRGFRSVAPLQQWEEQSFTTGDASLTVTSVPARHGPGALGRILPPVMGSVLQYRITPDARSTRIYISGDTIYYQGLAAISERFPDLDMAIVHLGGTRLLGAFITMDQTQGVDLLQLLTPRAAVPVHYDDYGIFTSPLSNFLAEVRLRHPQTVVRVLQRGETLNL